MKTAIVLLIFLFAALSLTQADDLKTKDGKIYKNITVVDSTEYYYSIQFQDGSRSRFRKDLIAEIIYSGGKVRNFESMVIKDAGQNGYSTPGKSQAASTDSYTPIRDFFLTFDGAGGKNYWNINAGFKLSRISDDSFLLFGLGMSDTWEKNPAIPGTTTDSPFSWFEKKEQVKKKFGGALGYLEYQKINIFSVAAGLDFDRYETYQIYYSPATTWYWNKKIEDKKLVGIFLSVGVYPTPEPVYLKVQVSTLRGILFGMGFRF